MFLQNIQKVYGKQYKIIEYNRGFHVESYKCKKHNQSNCQMCHPRRSETPDERSIIRTKTTITDYCLTNKFELFCTFTFNPLKVDSFSIKETHQKMSNWIRNQKQNSPNIQYLLVPEFHKSGRIHFHALISNLTTPLIDTNLEKNQRKIYNIQKWNWGFSTAIKIDNTEKVAYYMQKYITKEMISKLNKKRYWASRNLKKPVINYNINIDSVTLERSDVKSTYKTEYFTIYKSNNMLQTKNITNKWRK
jgi:hypothetical protein